MFSHYGLLLKAPSTGLKREDLFITSKLWLDNFGRENVIKGYTESLKI